MWSTIMINELRNLIDQTNERVVGQVLLSRKNKLLYNWIMAETTVLSEVTIKERVWFLLNGRPNSVCELGNKKTFNPKTKKYGFCDNISKCDCFKEHLSDQKKGMDLSYVIEKRVSTWQEKYGVENVAMLTEVQNKRKKTISQNNNHSEIYKKLAHDKETKGFEQITERVKDKVENLFSRDSYNGSRIINKYPWKCISCGHEFIDYVDSGRTPVCKKCNPDSISAGEKEIKEYIHSLGISNIVSNTKKILKNLEYDIYLPDHKVAIEFNGIYWHSDLFKSSSYHVNKFIQSREIGVHLIQIFEDEWINKKNIVKNRIKSLLGLSKKIYARNCTVMDVSSEDYKKFVEENHLQGYAACSYKHGLYHDGNLVAVMSFSKSRYTNSGYELIRYCSSETVVGGAGKLFADFIKKINPELVISYANRCWSQGNLYYKLGFDNETSDDLNVGYWYVKNGKRYHRSNFTKKRLMKFGENSDLTESQIMKNNGFLKIYDCGNYKFVWKKKQ